MLVVSDEPEANERIERFAAGVDAWLVSVGMVSEGVDITRLRVGVCTPPPQQPTCSFARPSAAWCRVQDGADGETASMFIPDDPRLRRYAATICEQRDHILGAEVGDLLDEAGSGSGRSVFEPIASEALDCGAIVDGTELTAAEIAPHDEVNRRLNHEAGIAAVAAASIDDLEQRLAVAHTWLRTTG